MKKNDDNREHGYLTIDEFLALLTPGLREYMYNVWPSAKDDTHHPEDLASHASAYLDSTLRVIGTFGVNPIKVEEVGKN